MDEARLLEGVLRGVLGGRRKRGRRASRYLTGPSLALASVFRGWGVWAAAC